jgi:hypothetical protein
VDKETIVIDYFLSTDTRLRGSLLQLFFHCVAQIVITIHDLLLASFMGVPLQLKHILHVCTCDFTKEKMDQNVLRLIVV